MTSPPVPFVVAVDTVATSVPNWVPSATAAEVLVEASKAAEAVWVSVRSTSEKASVPVWAR